MTTRSDHQGAGPVGAPPRTGSHRKAQRQHVPRSSGSLRMASLASMRLARVLGAIVPTDTTGGPGDPASTTSTTVGPPPPPPEGGEAMAQIRIPKIGVDKIVVEGVT